MQSLKGVQDVRGPACLRRRLKFLISFEVRLRQVTKLSADSDFHKFEEMAGLSLP